VFPDALTYNTVPRLIIQPKRRKNRTTYSADQLEHLERSFLDSHYPSVQAREELGNQVKVTDAHVQVWFSNRRARWRKHTVHNKTSTPTSASVVQASKDVSGIQTSPGVIGFQTSPDVNSLQSSPEVIQGSPDVSVDFPSSRDVSLDFPSSPDVIKSSCVYDRAPGCRVPALPGNHHHPRMPSVYGSYSPINEI
jgi:hypothetical protein